MTRLSPWGAVLLQVLVVVSSAGAVLLRDPQTLYEPMWSTTPIGVCVFLLTPRSHRVLHGVAFGLAVLVGNLVVGHDLAMAAGIGAACLGEALIIVRLLTWGRAQPPPLRTWSDLLQLTAAAFAGSAFVAVLGGVFGISVASTSFTLSFAVVFWTHFAATLVVVPLVCLRPDSSRSQSGPLEMAIHLILLLSLGWVSYGPQQDLPVLFLFAPLLLWSAARFTPVVNTLTLVALWAVVLVQVSRRGGPFPDTLGADAPAIAFAVTQAFIAVSASLQHAFMISTSQERAAMDEVRLNEQRLRRMLASARGTAMIATDIHGRITWFSAGAEDMLGYTSAEVVGLHTPMMFYVPEELHALASERDVPVNFAMFTSLLRTGALYETSEWTIRSKDGGRRLSSLTVTAIAGADGQHTGYLAVITDISDQRETERALLNALDREREALAAMKAIDQVKSDFVSSVSHELRTPITSIVGYTELLYEGLGGDLTDNQRDIVERVDRNGRRLMLLIEDLLTLSEVESGNLRLAPTLLDLRTPVREAVKEMSTKAPELGLELGVEVDPATVAVLGDADQLERLVVNLLTNAFKFTPSGGRVEVRVAREATAAVLTVTDTGIGIPRDEQDMLFQRFFRSSLARAGEIQGTGLGLAIVRSIADAHRGTVELDSTEGLGTTVTVRLPLQRRVRDSATSTPAA